MVLLKNTKKVSCIGQFPSMSLELCLIVLLNKPQRNLGVGIL